MSRGWGLLVWVVGHYRPLQSIALVIRWSGDGAVPCVYVSYTCDASRDTALNNQCVHCAMTVGL